VYQTQGKSGEAEGLIKRVLAIRETALGANHPAAGASLNNLALVYAAQGKIAVIYSQPDELKVWDVATGREVPSDFTWTEPIPRSHEWIIGYPSSY